MAIDPHSGIVDADVNPVPRLGVTHQSLREQIRDLVRERVVRGDLKPGDRLVERVLADELGVSRVPVREALNLLKGEGFVQDIPRRGVIVTQLSRVDLDELFEVREALEVHSARLACLRATDNEIDELTDIVRRADDASAVGKTDELADLNARFHDAIPRMAHNRMLAATLEPLEGRLHWLLRQNRSPERLMAEHRHLAQAIADRDAERAAEVARRHVHTSRTICHELLFGDD